MMNTSTLVHDAYHVIKDLVDPCDVHVTIRYDFEKKHWRIQVFVYWRHKEKMAMGMAEDWNFLPYFRTNVILDNLVSDVTERLKEME